MSKKVLVTGHTGFLGHHVIEPLIAAGFEIIFTGRQFPIKEIHLDLLDPEQIKYVMEYHKPEYLLHLAWDVNPGYRNNPNNIFWMNASLQLVHHFANNGGRKAVIAGTCFDSNPDTLYGTCKRSLWNILNYAKFTESLELAYGRIYYMYGPHEHRIRLIPSMINGLLDNEVVEVKSLASQQFNLIYVQDVAEAFVHVLNSDIAGEFDLVGDTVSLESIANTITELFDVDHDRIILGTENLYEDTRQPQRAIGSSVKIPLIRGLTRTIEWWKEQRYKETGI